MLCKTKVNVRQIHQLINSKIYPIDNHRSSDYQNLISNSRKQFIDTGCLYLPHFLTQQTVVNVRNEINQILINSSNELFQSVVQHTENLYETSANQLNENETSSKTIIAYDQIPLNSLLRRIYLSNHLIDFLRDIIQIYPKLYPSRDPLGALYVNIYRQSDQLNWHKDHSHFFVNLLFQQSTEGIFQYKINENSPIISRNDFQSGGLVLFNGRAYSHRITRISQSNQSRINAILTYDCHDRHVLSDYVSQKFFGRISKK